MEKISDKEYIQSEEDTLPMQILEYAQMLEIAEHERFEDIRESMRSRGSLYQPKNTDHA